MPPGEVSVMTNLDPQNILIIKPSSIGDVVHTLPVWNLLRKHYPQARISWLVARHVRASSRDCPELRLLRFERKGWAKAWYSPSAAGDLLRFQRQSSPRAL